jgi:hypothetical protein
MQVYRLTKLSLAIGLSVATTSVIASPQTFMTSRSFAMGGTGVAVAHPAEAASRNPALMSADQHDWTDDFGLILPSANIRVADEEEVRDQIDDIQDSIDNIDMAIDNNNTGAAQSNAAILRNQLKKFDEDTVRANIGLGLSLAVPSKTLSVGVFANGNLAVSVRGNYDTRDDATLAAIESGTLPPGNLSDELYSSGSALGSAVSEVGIAFAHSFDLNDRDSVQIGVSPKYVNLQTFQYTESISGFDDEDFDGDDYKTDKSGFNLDIGAAYAFGDTKQWNAGVAIKNLIPMKLDSAQFNPDPSINEPIHTLKVDPMVTVGIAHKGQYHVITAEADLTKRKAFGYEDDTQWLALGAEFDAWRYVQLRAGVRHNMASNNDGNGTDEETQFTAGFGVNLLGVRMDLGALYSSADVGAALEFGTAF